MWSSIMLCVIGLSAGLVVAFAVLSLATGVGVYPCLINRTHSAKHILCYETLASIGIVLGSIGTVFDVDLHGAGICLPVIGVFWGMYVGCFLMALAEVLKGFPIGFRRLHIKEGLSFVIFMVALGKLIGSLLYFYRQMWK